MRAEHSEIKAKTETETSINDSIARESKTNRYALLCYIYYIGCLKIINDE